MHRILVSSLSLLLILAFLTIPAVAQDETTPITGDPNNASLAVVQSFFNTDFSEQYLAGDVSYDDPTLPSPIDGLADLTTTQSLFFGEAFSEVRIEPMHYVAVDDTVVAEFFFLARHTGTYYTAVPSNQDIALQVAGVFEVSDDVITTMRLYYDIASLNTQVGYTPGMTSAVPAVTADDLAIVDVDTIEEDLDSYVGQVVSVSGEVDAILSDWAFVLKDEDIFDLTGQEYLLVLAGPSGVFEFALEEGASIDVLGTVRTFALDELQATVGYELDDALLADYSDLPVVINDVDVD